MHHSALPAPTYSPRPIAGASAVALGCLALLMPLSFRGQTPIWLFNQGESGIWLDEAVAVLEGRVMYRDFFEFVGPGVVYVNALILGLLGRTVLAAQTIPLLVGVIVAVLLFRISSKLVGGIWPFFAPFIVVSLVYPRYNFGNHKWLAWIGVLIAVDLLVTPRLSTARVATAGLFTGLAALCTQDLGVQAATGLLIAMWPQTPLRTRVVFVASATVAVLAVLSYFAYHAGVTTLWYDLIAFPLTQYRNANGGFAFAPFFSASRLPVYLLQWFVSGAAITAGVAYLYLARQEVARRDAVADSWRFIVWPGLVIVAVQSLSRAVEPTQTAVRCTLLLVALAGILEHLARRFGRSVRATATLLIAGSLLVVIMMIAGRQSGSGWLVPTRAGTIWSMSPLHDARWLHANTTAGERVFLLPDKGGVFFLTQTRNATSYPYLQDMGFSSDHQVAEAIAQLGVVKPRVGVFDVTRLYTQGPIKASSLRPLYQFLTDHYHDVDGMYFVLRSSLPEAGIDNGMRQSR
jgi:hypothetical protein